MKAGADDIFCLWFDKLRTNERYINLKTAVGNSAFAITSCTWPAFSPHPDPLPKGEGAFSLLPEGQGLGMRGAVFTL
jgi:hypothetical protein